MGLMFGNLAGLWALLGVPVILLIHFLQKERREVVASTLFLLENMQRESKSGIRFERLRNSLPLWLQILAVLLLTWLLTEPRWVRPDSFQRVVVVLDSSASMSAFREDALASLDRRIARILRASARQEWIVLETDQRRGTLYSGDDAAAMNAALAKWRPRAGTHDFTPALEEARSLLRREGSVVFVTSRPHENLPAGVHLLAAGAPIENSGFTGLRLEEREEGLVWQVLARNYGRIVQTREWQAAFGEGGGSPRQPVRLEPGQTVSLSGRFPDGEEEGSLIMEGDKFGLDDWLPLVRPQPKPLAILVEEHPLLTDFSRQFLASLSDWHPPVRGQADLRLATRLSRQGQPAQPGIYFLAEPETPARLLTAALVAENHPLMRELNWQGLLVQAEAEPPELADEDRVLLWQGERPLIVLRQSGPAPGPPGSGEERDGALSHSFSRQWLFCNFDLRHSNAARLPAFIVLLHRFLDQVREAKPGFEQRNLQTGQSYGLAADPLGGEISLRFRGRDGGVSDSIVPAHRGARLVAPGEPGFLQVQQAGEPLLRAAVHFADAREADFREAASEERGPEGEATLARRNTTADFLAPVWLLLLGGVLVYSWFLTGRREG